MDKSAKSSRVSSAPVKASALPRHFWTPKEDEVLLDLLDKLVAEGWKCDGTFQGGYMNRLAREMNEKLPGCGLMVKHVRSKLTVWKRAHATIQALLGSSGAHGFTMDPTLNMLVEDRPDAWNDYQKADPNAVKLVKGKVFPWHVRWLFIFGKDHASGTERYDIEDARNEVQNLSLNSDSIDELSTNPSQFEDPNTAVEEDDASSKGSSKNQSAKKNVAGKKRKSLANDPEKMCAMIGEWMETTKSQISDVSAKMLPTAPEDVGQPGDDSMKRARIYTAITEACQLDMDQVITAAHHFSHSKQDMDTFWGMSVEARARYVGMVLHGKFA